MITRQQLSINRSLGLKHCFACEQTKPFADFANERTRIDGLSPRCRKCTALARRQRLAKDPEYDKRRSAERRASEGENLNAQARERYHRDVEHSRAKERKKLAANPEKYKTSAKIYRQTHREKTNEASKLAKRRKRLISRAADQAYAVANRDKKREASRLYRLNNAAAINERNRTRHKERSKLDPAYVERCRAQVKKYSESHAETIRAIRRNRKARIRNACGTHTAADIDQLFKLQKGRCANPKCRKRLSVGQFHIDHIVPIARGGSNDRRNLQLMCAHCNQAKHSKDPVIWAREHGLLI